MPEKAYDKAFSRQISEPVTFLGRRPFFNWEVGRCRVEEGPEGHGFHGLVQ